MKKVGKRAISFLLTLVMLLSMVYIDASASGTLEYTVSTEPSTVDAGRFVIVTVGIKNNTGEVAKISCGQFGLLYDSKVLEPKATGETPFTNSACTIKGTTVADKDLDWALGFGNKAQGKANITISSNSGLIYNLAADEEISVAKIAFKVQDGAESSETVIRFDSKYENLIYKDNNKDQFENVGYTDTATITINGTAPVLSKVTVSTDKAGNEVILSSDNLSNEQDYTVTVDGKTVTPQNTYYAHAYSAMGTDITSSVTWTIGSGLDGNKTISKDGVITISPLANNTTSTISATQAGANNDGVGTRKSLIVQRTSDSTRNIHTIKVTRTGGDAPLIVPTGNATVTATFSVDAKNIYGGEAKENIYWKVLPAEEASSVPTNYGISFDDKTLTLTVDNLAKSHTGTYRVYAEGASTGVSHEVLVTIKLADPEVRSLTVDTTATTTFAIPKADETGHGTENYSLPAVTVKDQYGRDVENPTLTWQTMGSTVYPGITIKDGKLVVTSEAAKPELFPEGKNEYQVPIRVSCDEKFADFTVIVTREARKAASITVSGGPTATLLVPASGESGVTSNEKFTAVVKDQYGHTIEGASVTWSAAKGGLWGSTGSDVSMTEDGCVTVSSAAAKEILNTKDVTLTAVATFGDDVYGYVYGYKDFTVARAASVVKSISITSASNTVEIPGSVSYDGNGEFNGPEKDNTVSFTVTVKDQYNTEIKDPDVSWSIAPKIYGVEIAENGILTVKSNAAKSIATSQKFTVTATSKTDSNVKDEATVTVQRGTPKFSGFNLYQIFADGTETKLTSGRSAHILSVTATPMTVKYQAKPCDQYGINLAENVIPEGLNYAIKMFKMTSYVGREEVPDAQFTKGNQTNPGVLTIDEAKPAAGNYLVQVVVPGNDGKKSVYYVDLMRKADAGLNVTKPGGGYVGDTLELAYGDVMDKLSITVDKTSGSYGVKWSSSDPSVLSITNSTGTTPTLTARKPGTATVTVIYEDAENYGSKTFTVNVSKRVLTVTEGSFKISKVYDGKTTIASGFTGDFTVSNRLEKDTVNIACNSYPAYPSADVGKYTNELTLTLTGKDADNYTLKSDKVSVPYEITPATLTIASATATNRGYVAGKTDVEISGVTFTNTSSTTVVPGTGDYDARGVMSDANAGTKDVTVTVTLTGQAARNYTLANNTCQTTVKINQAAHGTMSVNDLKAKYGNTATLNLKALNLSEGYTFGAIGTTDTDNIFAAAPALEGNTLRVKLVADQAKVGETGTITIPVSSTNYQDFNLTVTVTVLDKTAQTLSADAINTVYGESFTPNVSGAKTELTYRVKAGSESLLKYDRAFTAIGAGKASIVVTAAETEEYAPAVLEIQVNIAKRTLTVKAADKSAYVGEKLPELTYQVTGLVGSDKLTKEPTLKLVHEAEVDPMKKAGEYVITFAQAPEADTTKYDLGTADGKLTVSVRPVYVGPTGSPVEVGRSDNGTVTASPANAAKGTTVTITANPGKGQELKSLEVLDQHGSSLPLTDLGNGKFSFVMPAGKVTVKPVFGAANAYVNPYMDVQTNDWYFGAVQYVTENGLMNGTGNGFEPNLATSRAMIWTILARMSNVNTASGGEWYAVAQQWAKANGVSDGTMPNGTITREQLAAMLYRYAVSKGMVKAPVTANLSIFAGASSVSTYANEAMQWAVSTGLINGMDGKLNPQGSATRAQVATMLMRFAELLK